MKTTKQLERYCKGVANHRRIQILRLLNKKAGLNLISISEHVACNHKTISEHTRRLVQAGLLNKKYQGSEVLHTLSPYGIKFVKFLNTF